MSTPTRQVEQGNEKDREDGNNPASNGEGSSARRGTRIIPSAAQTARAIWQSRYAGTQSDTPGAVRPSESMQATTAQSAVQNRTTTPEGAQSAIVQPTADDPGDSSSQSRYAQVEGLVALLSRLSALVNIRVRTRDGSQPAWNAEVATSGPSLRYRLPLDGLPVEDIEVEVILREREPEEPGSAVARGCPQEVQASSGDTQAIQDPQFDEVDELIVPLRTSRPYQMSFDQEQRRRQAETDAFPGPSTDPTSQTLAASSSQNPAAEAPPTCTICYEPFTTRSALVPCGHEFDVDCILPWFQSIYNENLFAHPTCPLCRQRTQFIRHRNNARRNFQLVDIEGRFRPHLPWPDPTIYPNVVPHPGWHDDINILYPGPRRPPPPEPAPWSEQFRRQAPEPSTFIEFSREDFLDFDVIDTMSPQELKDFIDIIDNLSHDERARISRDDLEMLARRRDAIWNTDESSSRTADQSQRRRSIPTTFRYRNRPPRDPILER